MNLNVKMKTKSVTMVIIAESVLRKRPLDRKTITNEIIAVIARVLSTKTKSKTRAIQNLPSEYPKPLNAAMKTGAKRSMGNPPAARTSSN